MMNIQRSPDINPFGDDGKVNGFTYKQDKIIIDINSQHVFDEDIKYMLGDFSSEDGLPKYDPKFVTPDQKKIIAEGRELTNKVETMFNEVQNKYMTYISKIQIEMKDLKKFDKFYVCKKCKCQISELFADIHQCDGFSPDKLSPSSIEEFIKQYPKQSYMLGQSVKIDIFTSMFESYKANIMSIVDFEYLKNYMYKYYKCTYCNVVLPSFYIDDHRKKCLSPSPLNYDQFNEITEKEYKKNTKNCLGTKIMDLIERIKVENKDRLSQLPRNEETRRGLENAVMEDEDMLSMWSINPKGCCLII